MTEKVVSGLRWVIPVLMIYPAWAKLLFAITLGLLLVSIVVFGAKLQWALEGLDQSRRPRLSPAPYDAFSNNFRELIAPHEVPETGSLVHVVWGDMAQIRQSVVVLPTNQAFDMTQRGPTSVLFAFEPHTIKGSPFFDYIEQSWPRSQRPSAAGLGTTKFLPFQQESNELLGAMFVVSTRNLGDNAVEYGLYRNTPVEGVDLILEPVFKTARMQKLSCIALPLVGTGYANIRRTHSNPELLAILRQAVALISLDRMTKALADSTSSLRRAILVLRAEDFSGSKNDDLFRVVSAFLRANKEAREKMINEKLECSANRKPRYLS